MPGTLLKGALLEFTPDSPQPNVIAFQYNPESLTHSWVSKGDSAGTAQANPLAVKGVPGETFDFTIYLDSQEALAGPGKPLVAGVAEKVGVYPRLAALEMLQWPVRSDAYGKLLGTVPGAGAAGGAAGAAKGAAPAPGKPGSKDAKPAPQNVPAMQVPLVLFVWGPNRILPVRVALSSAKETLYDALLNPAQVCVTLKLTVLTSDDLKSLTGSLADMAKAAYDYTQQQRQTNSNLSLDGPGMVNIGLLPVLGTSVI